MKFKNKFLEYFNGNMFYRWGEISKGKWEVVDKVELKIGEYDIVEVMWKKCFMEEIFLWGID